MKITKSQLKQIIKEELEQDLEERHEKEHGYGRMNFPPGYPGKDAPPPEEEEEEEGEGEYGHHEEKPRSKYPKGTAHGGEIGRERPGRARLEEIIKEELEAVMAEEGDRTAKGNVTQDARDDHATLSDGRFPIFDKKSALAALKLRGHGTTDAERKKIVNKAAEYAPAAAKKAREADKKD